VSLNSFLTMLPPDAEYPLTIHVTPKMYRALALGWNGLKTPSSLEEEWDARRFPPQRLYAGMPLQLEIETPPGLVIIPNPEVTFSAKTENN
jgi:hypothetical protein